MTTWTRQETPGLCGYCGHVLETGAAVFVLQTERWRKVRCELCAGPAPPDLPALGSPPQRFAKPMTSVRGLATMVKFNRSVK